MWPRRVAALALALLAACSSPPPSADDTAAAKLAPLKARYPQVIMGFDVHGTTVNVSVDLDQLVSMDEDKEDAMKAVALKTWAKTWSEVHPHQHASLTMRIIDFRGNQESAAHIKV
ncbi:MAG: hypothetical protein KGN02_06370 [bacterium]|nr:hypothetical protein [bacterium]